MGTPSTLRACTSSAAPVERVLLPSLSIDNDNNDKPTAFNNTGGALKNRSAAYAVLLDHIKLLYSQQLCSN